MAKSKIIKEIANNEITIDVALNRLFIIASDINNSELQGWAEFELNGYGDHPVPDYRIAKDTFVRFTGIRGQFQFTNSPLPLKECCFESNPEALYANITDSIATLETFSKQANTNMCRDLTYLASLVYKKTGTQCSSITQYIPNNVIENVIHQVKTILMKIFLKLEKTYGCLDELDIDCKAIDPQVIRDANVTINNYIYSDKSVTIGDKNKIEDTGIMGG